MTASPDSLWESPEGTAAEGGSWPRPPSCSSNFPFMPVLFVPVVTDSAPTPLPCPSPRPIPGFTSKPQTPPHHGSGHGVYQTFVGQHRGHGATLFTQAPQSVWLRERIVSSPTSQESRPPHQNDCFRVTDCPGSLGRRAGEVSVKCPGTPLNTDWPGSIKGRGNVPRTRKNVFRAPPVQVLSPSVCQCACTLN